MISAVVRFFHRLPSTWVAWACRHAVAVVVVAVAATAVAAAYVGTHLAINTDTDDMLRPDLPFRQHARAVSVAFPLFSDNILIVIDGANPDLADDAARALAARLGREPGLFGAVFDPAADPFFRRNGLLYLEPGELARLADRLAQAQPFLGKLWAAPGLPGFADMLGLAIDQTITDDAAPAIALAPVLDAVAEVAEAQAEGRFALLSWRELMAGKSADAKERRRTILIQPVLDYGSLRPAGRAMEAVRAIARELALDPAHGVRVRLTGSAALAEEELESVQQGAGIAGVLSFGLVGMLMIVGLRSWRLVAAAMVTLVVGLVGTAAFALVAVGQLNLISVTFAVLFIGLSVDFAIHFGLRYGEARRAGEANGTALDTAAKGVGHALVLCAVAAAIGFFSFLPTAYVGLAQLGLIAGASMFVALVANLTLLPALLALAPVRAWPAARATRPRLNGLVGGRAGAVVTVSAVLAIGAAAVVPWARFDHDPLNLKDRDTESVSTLFDLMKDVRTSPYSVTVLTPNLAAADALARRLETLKEVANTETLTDFVPHDQKDKLAMIQDMALFLAPALQVLRVETASDPERRRSAFERLRADVDRLATVSGNRELAAAAGRLSRALAAPGEPAGAMLAEFERRLMALFPARIDALRESLTAGPVGLEDLPSQLRRGGIAADGQARLEVFPREDLHRHEALERFVAAVRALAPSATGPPIVILEAGAAVIAAFHQAATLAMVAITVLLALILRNVRDVVLVLLPLVLAALLTVAGSVLLDMPFNYANIIVLPLLFGLGVANGIHLVLRERAEGGVADALATSTPRAVVFSALTTLGSFASLALSPHRGTASMGILLTIAIAFTLLTTLVSLPALMVVVRATRRRLPPRTAA